MEAPGGVEPPTNGLGNRCSIQLSYGAESVYRTHFTGLHHLAKRSPSSASADISDAGLFATAGAVGVLLIDGRAQGDSHAFETGVLGAEAMANSAVCTPCCSSLRSVNVLYTEGVQYKKVLFKVETQGGETHITGKIPATLGISRSIRPRF